MRGEVEYLMHFSWWISSTVLFGNPFAKHQTALQLHNCADSEGATVLTSLFIRFFQFTVGNCMRLFLLGFWKRVFTVTVFMEWENSTSHTVPILYSSVLCTFPVLFHGFYTIVSFVCLKYFVEGTLRYKATFVCFLFTNYSTVGIWKVI